MRQNDFFIDVDCSQVNKQGCQVCGDVFLSRKLKAENRLVSVLSDGLGSGIKANVLATLTASMALNFTSRNEPVDRSAEIIMNTLPVDSDRHISYATFSIVDIDADGETRIVEYDNPRVLVVRNQSFYVPQRRPFCVTQQGVGEKCMSYLNFTAQKEDRIILMTDGITQSGIGQKNMPFGWGDEVQAFILATIQENPTISAHELAKKIVTRANRNDIYQPKDDSSCSVIYFREPRKSLICTGPPFEADRDRFLADYIRNFNGRTIVSGGTTSQIIARELKKEITVDLIPDPSGLPPVAHMDGIDLVTEGILTLGKVCKRLEEQSNTDVQGEGVDADIVRIFFESDIIYFMVGTRVNNAHQDPNLPEELEIRRNVIKRIVSLLEEKFLKEVSLKFI